MNFKILIILWIGSKLECDSQPGFWLQILPQLNQVKPGLTCPSWFSCLAIKDNLSCLPFQPHRNHRGQPGRELFGKINKKFDRQDSTASHQTYLGRGQTNLLDLMPTEKTPRANYIQLYFSSAAAPSRLWDGSAVAHTTYSALCENWILPPQETRIRRILWTTLREWPQTMLPPGMIKTNFDIINWLTNLQEWPRFVPFVVPPSSLPPLLTLFVLPPPPPPLQLLFLLPSSPYCKFLLFSIIVLQLKSYHHGFTDQRMGYQTINGHWEGHTAPHICTATRHTHTFTVIYISHYYCNLNSVPHITEIDFMSGWDYQLNKGKVQKKGEKN